MFNLQKRDMFNVANNHHFDLSMSHICWKAKFRTAITNHEVFDVAKIAKDDCCELGKWLHDDEVRQKISHLQSYLHCVLDHAAVHREASKVAALANADNYYDALQALNGMSAFSRAFMNLISSTFNLERDINIFNELNVVDDFCLMPC